jgi:hypothetical protein
MRATDSAVDTKFIGDRAHVTSADAAAVYINTVDRPMEVALLLRSLIVASVITLSCVATALPAQAQSRGFNGRGGFERGERFGARGMDGHGGAHMRQTNGVTSRQFDVDHYRRRHHHFGPLVPFGFSDGFTGFESSGAAAVAELPSSEFDALSPGPPRLDADRPPCHETTPQGTVILRGKGCSRSAH